MWRWKHWSRNIKSNDIWHNDIQQLVIHQSDTFCIMTFCIMTFCIVTFCIMIFSILTMFFHNDIMQNNIQHNDSQHIHDVHQNAGLMFKIITLYRTPLTVMTFSPMTDSKTAKITLPFCSVLCALCVMIKAILVSVIRLNVAATSELYWMLLSSLLS